MIKVEPLSLKIEKTTTWRWRVKRQSACIKIQKFSVSHTVCRLPLLCSLSIKINVRMQIYQNECMPWSVFNNWMIWFVNMSDYATRCELYNSSAQNMCNFVCVFYITILHLNCYCSCFFWLHPNYSNEFNSFKTYWNICIQNQKCKR